MPILVDKADLQSIGLSPMSLFLHPRLSTLTFSLLVHSVCDVIGNHLLNSFRHPLLQVASRRHVRRMPSTFSAFAIDPSGSRSGREAMRLLTASDLMRSGRRGTSIRTSILLAIWNLSIIPIFTFPNQFNPNCKFANLKHKS